MPGNAALYSAVLNALIVAIVSVKPLLLRSCQATIQIRMFKTPLRRCLTPNKRSTYPPSLLGSTRTTDRRLTIKTCVVLSAFVSHQRPEGCALVDLLRRQICVQCPLGRLGYISQGL
jgi:hypothetical protein